MDIVTLGAAIGAAKKNLNNVVAPVSASDAGKIATVDSNGKYQAAALTVGQGEVAVDSTLLVSGAAADALVTGSKIEVIKSDAQNLPYEIYNPAKNTDGKYLDANGAEQTQSGWSITDYLRIGENAQYYLKTSVSSNAVKSCYYDKDKQFISAFKTNKSGNNTLSQVANAKYIRFSVQTTDVNDFKYSSIILVPYENGIVNNQLVKNAELSKSFKNYLYYGSYYSTDGTLATSSAWAHTELYAVNEGDSITIQYGQDVYAVLFDSSKAFVSYKNGSGPATFTFSVPSGVSYVGFNVVVSNIDNYNIIINNAVPRSEYKVPWIDTGVSNIWENKTYISHGDSITWQDGKAWAQGPEQGEIAVGYQTILHNTVGLKKCNNQGKSGWPMAVVNSNGVVNTIMAISDYSIYDLCTIACGTNDFKLNVPLGTLGVIGDTTFDDTTFYGAYRKAIEYILTNSPTIRIVLMTPLQRDNDSYDVNYTNSAGCKLIDYVNAIISIGEMYGIPVCDMYRNSGFTKKTLSTYTLDGLHPNTEGYKRMASYLIGFLSTVGC